MKRSILLFSVFALISFTTVYSEEKYPAVRALIHRVVPQIEDKIVVDSIANEKGNDVFEIYSSNGKIYLSGSSPVAVSSALNWYLKYYCKCQYSYSGKDLKLPKELPGLSSKIRIASPYKHRYFLNYCTFNYTMSFWGWEQWQKELDWMALQGINLVLAINGTEEVWQNTLKRLDFPDKEIADFICGPAYQAWWLMGNLEGWGGPVSQKWIKSRTELQKNILSYMKGMHMEPVLQGFYGMVPTTLKSKFPKADIRSTGEWCQYIRPDFIMPTDSMFQVFAKLYYQELEKLYGKANYYGGDPFHEGSILNVDLKTCGKNIQKSMQEAAPGSTWVLQGWIENPSPVLLSGVNKDKTLIIDLYCESNKAWKISKGFNGCRWLFCTINNFGARTELYGKIDSTTLNLDEARKSEYAGKLEGIGVIPEGINANPLIFDYIFELGWRNELPDPVKWAEDYSVYRYGKDNATARLAWKKIAQSVYNIPFRFDEPQNVICSRPTLKWEKTAPWGLGAIRYNQKDLKEACSILLECSDELKNSDAYQYDAVDITHQYLIGVAEESYKKTITAFESKDRLKFETYSKRFLGLIKDLDLLMSTRKEFLLGNWIKEARTIAPTDVEKKLFEQNARMLITTWGYGNSHKALNDYAHKEWAGLIGTFCLGRWSIFMDDLKNQLNGQKAVAFDYAQWEEEWTKQENEYPSIPQGDAIATSKKMLEKYNE